MTPQKPAPAPHPPTADQSATGARKPWVKKTPVEVVLDQIGRQEHKVAQMRDELAREERELAKLHKAKTVLEEK